MESQQCELNNASEELLEKKSLICDLRSQLLIKDDIIIELHGLREEGERKYKARIDELSQEVCEKMSAFNKVNQEVEGKNLTIDQLNSDLDGLKCELQRFKLHEQDLKKHFEEAQKLVQSLHTAHREELEVTNEQHAAELENLRLLMSGQLQEKCEEMDELKQMYGSKLNKNKELKQKARRLALDWDNSVVRLRVKDATLEELRLKTKELKTTSASEINSLKKVIKERNEEKAALEDKLLKLEIELELNDESSKYERKLAEEVAQMESQYKHVIQGLLGKVDQLMAERESLKTIHAQEIEVLKGNLAQNTSVFEEQIHELQSKAEKEYQHKLLDVATEMRRDKEQELSQMKEKMLQESQAKIASMQESLFEKIQKAEEENQQLKKKLISVEKDLSEVTGERNEFLDEIEILKDTRRMLEESMALLEQSIGRVSNQGVHEELQSPEGIEDLPGAGFPQGNVLYCFFTKPKVENRLPISLFTDDYIAIILQTFEISKILKYGIFQ